MAEQVIWLSSLEGGQTWNDKMVRLRFLSDATPVEVEMPRAEMQKLAALALVLASDARAGRASPMAAESVEVHSMDPDQLVLSFGIGSGTARFALDPTLAGELRHYLKGG